MNDLFSNTFIWLFSLFLQPFDQPVKPYCKPATSNLAGVTPPAPGCKGREIQYLYLDMDPSDADPKPKSSTLNKSPTAAMSSTDYKEIDFIKTRALSDTRKDREHTKRTSSDKSIED